MIYLAVLLATVAVIIGMIISAIVEYRSNDILTRVRANNICKRLIVATVVMVAIFVIVWFVI